MKLENQFVKIKFKERIPGLWDRSFNTFKQKKKILSYKHKQQYKTI